MLVTAFDREIRLTERTRKIMRQKERDRERGDKEMFHTHPHIN